MNGNEKLYVVLGGNGNATVSVNELSAFIINAIESGGKLTISSEEINDATTLGKELITAKDAATALTDLGAGTTGISVFKSADNVTARSAINAASAGTNSDIHALTGLTTPLTVAQGGTGNNTGLAAEATKLATSRKITVNIGTAAATPSFDGTADITATAVLSAATSSALGGVKLGAAVADTTDSTTAPTTINALLASLRSAGIIASS